MRCLQHVLWRGAMALSLVIAGVGSGYGLYEAPVQSGQSVEACAEDAVARMADTQPLRSDSTMRRTRMSMRRG